MLLIHNLNLTRRKCGLLPFRYMVYLAVQGDYKVIACSQILLADKVLSLLKFNT